MVDATMVSKISPLCERLGVRLVNIDSIIAAPTKKLPEISPERCAMILYTSGTTSKPKGVMTTHANIQAQVESLVQAWEWSATDSIPLFLPLHHIHGIINILSCALWTRPKILAVPTPRAIPANRLSRSRMIPHFSAQSGDTINRNHSLVYAK